MTPRRHAAVAVAGSLLAAGVLVGLTRTALGTIPTLIALPMLVAVPGFGATGRHVQYWFLGVTPVSTAAWIAFTAYYTLVALGVYGLVVGLLRLSRRKPR